MTRPTATPRAQRGAVAVQGGGQRRRPAWLLPLLALLAIAAIVILLIALLGGDDGSTTSPQSSGSATATPGGAGSFESGGQDLFALAANGGLKSAVGRDTVGSGLVVQEVNRGNGFWVGNQTDRIYVEYGGAAGKTEAGFKPDRVGQKVDLDGPVRAAPADPVETLKLSPQDAAQVKSAGAYVNANKVSPAR